MSCHSPIASPILIPVAVNLKRSSMNNGEASVTLRTSSACLSTTSQLSPANSHLERNERFAIFWSKTRNLRRALFQPLQGTTRREERLATTKTWHVHKGEFDGISLGIF